LIPVFVVHKALVDRGLADGSRDVGGVEIAD
jgi:hypothetical protein